MLTFGLCPINKSGCSFSCLAWVTWRPWLPVTTWKVDSDKRTVFHSSVSDKLEPRKVDCIYGCSYSPYRSHSGVLTCIWQRQWVSKVFPSPYSNILHRIFFFFLMQCHLKVWSTHFRLFPLPLVCRDSPRFSECFDYFMACRWWNPQIP